jgi:O-antigen/teichoic acid export membrane protein
MMLPASKASPVGLARKAIRDFFDKKTGSGKIMRNMTVLATGTSIAQVVGLATGPVIARIYSPADFGALSVFVSFIAFMTPFVTMRYCAAIPLPRLTGTAANLLVLCLSLAIVTSVAFGLVLWLFGGFVFGLFSMPELAPFSWLLVLGLLATGLYETFRSWAIREKLFKTVAKTKVRRALSGSLAKIALGLMALKPHGLLIGHVVAEGAGLVSIFLRSKADLLVGLRRVERRRVVFLAKRYFSFPKYQIPSRFLLVLIRRAPLLALAIYFDKSVVGQLGLAFMVVALPTDLVIGSVSQAYLADIAAIGKKQSSEIYAITKSVSQKMFVLGLFPCLVLFLFGPVLFEFVFGQRWNDAGRFASILSVLLLFRFVASPVISSMIVLEKQHLIFIMNIVTTLLTLLVFSIPLVISCDAFAIMRAYVGVITALSVLYYYVVLRTIKGFDS